MSNGNGSLTKCLPPLMGQVADGIRQGLKLKQAAIRAGVHPTSVYEWRKRGLQDHPEEPYATFVALLDRAETDYVEPMVTGASTTLVKVLEGADEEEVSPTRAKAAMWVLERLRGDLFGKVLQVEATVEEHSVVEHIDREAAFHSRLVRIVEELRNGNALEPPPAPTPDTPNGGA